MKKKLNPKSFMPKIKDFITSNKVFLIFVIISLLNGLLLRIMTIGSHIYIRASIADLLVILIIGSFSYLIKESSRYLYYLIWIIFSCALAVGNTIYYQFYQSYISINLIGTASMVGQVNDSLWAKIHINQFIYVIFPLVFVFIHRYFVKHNIKDSVLNGKMVFKRIMIVNLVILFGLIIFSSKSDGNRFVKLWNRESVVKKYGLYVYTINDLVQSIKPSFAQAFGYDESSYTFRNYYACKFGQKTEINEYTDIFKGKNVLFIHAESIQNFLVNLKVNGVEVTPNINNLAKNGLYFSKFYPQISVGTSSDTEFTLNTGLMPSSSGTVFVNFFDRTYYAMPQYFKNMGYYTFSTHANNAEYWNRLVMHNNLGYTDFFAKDSFIVPEDEEDSDYIGLGLSDKSFFKQLIPILKSIKNEKSPFYGTVITLSNHSPFNDVEKYGEFDVTMKYNYTNAEGKKVSGVAPYLEGTSVGNYLKSSHYADQALGSFLKDLKKEGILKNTVLIFYGDHEARLSRKELSLLYNYDPVNNDIISEEDPNYYDLYGYNYDLMKNTPFIIYTEDESLKGEITKVMGMYDVLPTMANMFGFEEKYSLGHDIFSNNEGIVVFPNGNVLTDKVYYSDLNEEYVAFSDEPIETDYIDKLKEYSDNILDVSNGIVTHDLIKNEGNRIGECINE